MGKFSWLKVDWSRFEDSDAEEATAPDGMDWSGMGGMGGMPGMGGMGGMPGMEGLGGGGGFDMAKMQEMMEKMGLNKDGETDEIPDLEADAGEAEGAAKTEE